MNFRGSWLLDCLSCSISLIIYIFLLLFSIILFSNTDCILAFYALGDVFPFLSNDSRKVLAVSSLVNQTFPQ
jgi:hypothetical protein